MMVGRWASDVTGAAVSLTIAASLPYIQHYLLYHHINDTSIRKMSIALLLLYQP